MIRLVVSDLDGTLLKEGSQNLPTQMHSLINELSRLSIRFVAASGRPYWNVRDVFAESASKISYICENGGVVILDEELLFQEFFPEDLMREILETMDETEKVELTMSTKDWHYLKPKSPEFEKMIRTVLRYRSKTVQSLSEIPISEGVKAAAYIQGREIPEILPLLQERFGKRCKVVTAGNNWIDFIPLNCGKGKGLKKMREALNISEEECVVFGDEYNDLDMLKSVRYSFAMTTAKPGVREEAAYQTDSVEKVLRQLVLSGGDILKVL